MFAALRTAVANCSLILLYEQVYAAPQAGARDDHPGAFHRAIFVFMSPDGNRLHEAGAVRAFRCQLPRINQYYSTEPSNEHLPPELPKELLHLDPWRTTGNELQPAADTVDQTACPTLLKELEIVVESGEEVLLFVLETVAFEFNESHRDCCRPELGWEA